MFVSRGRERGSWVCGDSGRGRRPLRVSCEWCWGDDGRGLVRDCSVSDEEFALQGGYG